jgi:heavy metal sensor kinase
MYFRSVRFKLTLWYVLILGVLLVSFSSFLYITVSKSLYRDVDNKLRALAELIASDSSSPLSKYGFGNIDQALEVSMNLKPVGKFIQLLDESGKVGPKSENLKNIQLPISLTALKNASKGLVTFETNVSFGNTPLRIVTLPVVDKSHISKIVQVASSLEDVEDALNTLLLLLTITVPFALMIASLGGQFLANKALKPVDQITNMARVTTSRNLNQRIQPLKSNDEISRLAETFNEMISGLDESFHKIKQFSTDASHELKTPLTILRGEIEVALLKERVPEEYRAILRSNLEEINRMSRIVDDLLLLSKEDGGELKLLREEIHLPEILDEVIHQMSFLAQTKRIRLEASSHRENVSITGDPLRIRELFINLIDNSIKYTEEGGLVQINSTKDFVPSASQRSERNGEDGTWFAKVVISDTGIGIAKEYQERIFDRFFRVDKARSREEGGSGLGLSICKWIVETHHGEMKVQSEVGRGSSFIVRLPIHQD